MSKIIIVGASGTIGRAVADLLGQTHQVIRVGNRQGDYTVDLSSKASIEFVFFAYAPCLGQRFSKAPIGCVRL